MRLSHQLGASLIALAGALTVINVVAPVDAQAQEAQTRTYDIPAGDLTSALQAFAAQSERNVLFAPALVQGKRSPGVRGQLTETQALQALLVGTGLHFEQTAANGYAVQDPNSPAQLDSENDAAADDAQGDGEIVVTGSRLRRRGYAAPQPVQTVDAQAIESTGLSNLSDIVNRLPEAGVGLGQANSYYNGDAGAAFLNLRGLGTNRTLVLVNGRRRVSGTELSSAVDLSTIPANMIERVEVITGGAAAVYGADAVTGVVNVVLKSDADGLELSARHGISSEGDASTYSLGALVGAEFADDRGHVVLGLSHNQEDPLQANQRAFGQRQVDLFGNPANTGPNDGIFDSIAVANYRYPGTSYGGAFVIDGVRYTYDQNGLRPTQNDETPYGPTGFLGVGGDGFNDADFAPLRNESEVTAGTVSLQYELTDAVRLFADAQYAHTSTVARLQPTFDLGITLSLDNPLIPDDVRALMLSAGQTTLTVGRTNVDHGANIRTVDRDTVTGVIGLEGDLGEDSHWLAFYQYGQYEADSTRTHNRIISRFNQAVDVIDSPTGPVCRDPVAQAAGCVPLNLFGATAATPGALAYFDYTSNRSVTNTQEVAGLQLTATPWELPAGPVQVAVGYEYRREGVEVTPDPRQAAGELLFLTDAAIDASFDVNEVFGEVLVPVLANRPLVEELSVEGAVRFSDYSSIGDTLAWKLGGQWAPSSDLRFRAVRSHSVRAPNLSELYNPGASSNVFILDPCDSTRVSTTPNRPTNCAALGISPSYTDPLAGVAKTIITGGNPDLTEETSDSWAVGAVVIPSAVPGLAVSVDWWRIDIEDAINTVPLQRAVDNCVDAATISNPFCDLVTRRSDGAITLVNVSPINVGSQNAQGIDVQANYRRMFGDVEARLNLAGSYLFESQLQVIADDPTTLDTNDGEVDTPKWRINITPGFSVGAFNFDWTLRYIPESQVDSQAGAETRDDNNVDARTYNDLFVSYDLAPESRVFAGVNNILNEEPPFSAVTFQGTGRGALYDNVGRYFFVGVNTSF